MHGIFVIHELPRVRREFPGRALCFLLFGVRVCVYIYIYIDIYIYMYIHTHVT